MNHRIFVAINLPEDVKKKLSDYRDKWPDLPARWTKKENLHITLEFLGHLNDEELLELSQRTKEMALKTNSFTLVLNKICYGPPVRADRPQKPPRMIWATGDKIKEFNLSPHITLARIKAWDFRKIEPEERTEISENINLAFEVNSIEVMESRLKREGPEYAILESFPLS